MHIDLLKNQKNQIQFVDYVWYLNIVNNIY